MLQPSPRRTEEVLVQSFHVEREDHEYPLMVMQATGMRSGRLISLAVIDPDDYADDEAA